MTDIKSIVREESSSIIKENLDLRNESWYVSLQDDCQAIITERSYQSRMTIIECKWELGERISRENDNLERNKIYGKHIVESLAKDLSVSSSGLWFCIQFYKQFSGDNFSNVLEKQSWGKNMSWYKITQEYLGKRDEKKGIVRVSYKLNEIIDAFKNWFKEYETGEIFTEEIDSQLDFFQKHLIKLRK